MHLFKFTAEVPNLHNLIKLGNYYAVANTRVNHSHKSKPNSHTRLNDEKLNGKNKYCFNETNLKR